MAESSAAADVLERKLATILSADVAAYSRLMAEDEERTLQTFRAHKEVFEKLVQLHRGRVFNTAGDAVLAEFTSAVEAVRCARRRPAGRMRISPKAMYCALETDGGSDSRIRGGARIGSQLRLRIK